MLVGEILNVTADESILTDGKVCISKLEPISYDPDNFTYLLVKDEVGKAFEDGKELIKK